MKYIIFILCFSIGIFVVNSFNNEIPKSSTNVVFQDTFTVRPPLIQDPFTFEDDLTYFKKVDSIPRKCNAISAERIELKKFGKPVRRFICVTENGWKELHMISR